MNEALRKLLEKRGLAADATDDQAWAFYEKLFGERQGDASDPPTEKTKSPRQQYQDDLAREEEIQLAEVTRQKEIRAMGKEWGMVALAEKLSDDPKITVDEARAIFMDRLRVMSKKDPALTGARGVTVTEDERDKFRAHATDSLAFRAGLPLSRLERFDPQGSDLVGRRMVDLAIECLRMASLPTSGRDEDILKRAMTSSDLVNILANVQNKFLFRGWEEAPTTWQVWCDTGSLNDYKPASFPRASAFPDLTEVNANKGEYTYAYIGDATETTQLKHWGKMIGLSLMALVNDDLGALSEVPTRMGKAASRTIDKYVYRTVLQGTAGAGETMGDANALFDDTNHGNYVGSGSGGAITATTIDVLAQKLENQMDSESQAFVGEAPRFVLANSYYRMALASVLVATNPTAVGDGASTIVYNPWKDITPVFTPHIHINSKKWWCLAGPKGNTVRVFGKNGSPQPKIDDQPGWTTAGWEYRVTMDFIAKSLDWKYMAANYGT